MLTVAGVTIICNDQGPYEVKGSITLIGPDGQEIRTEADSWLCRCGGSANKPFCDGTHNKVGGFGPAEAARQEYQRKKAES